MARCEGAQEQALIHDAKAGDAAALEALTQRYAPMVRALSGRFYLPLDAQLSREELVQSGYVGLMLAISRYDERSEHALGTYALSWILGEMRKAVKTAANQSGGYEQRALIKREWARYEAAHGREPTIGELSQACGLSSWQTAYLMNAASAVRYDDAPGEGAQETELLRDGENPYQKLEIKLALDALPREERQVILLRYFRDQSQIEAAKAVGKSQTQVSRIERRAIDHLKELLS